MSDLTDPLWGTGYGSKRHLVDVATHTMNRWGSRSALSRCKQKIDSFADDMTPSVWDARLTAAQFVASRLPCARCAKIAAKEAQS